MSAIWRQKNKWSGPMAFGYLNESRDNGIAQWQEHWGLQLKTWV